MRYGIVHYYNRKENRAMAVLEVRNVKKVFGDNVILRGIDLDVQKGDVIVILGPSGSGKTTFFALPESSGKTG